MKLPPQTLISRNDGEVLLDLAMLSTLDAFHDHFPEHPILPGVVQVDWAIRLAHEHLKLDLTAARNFQVKFRNIICPGMTVTLKLKHEPKTQRLTFDYRHGDAIMSSGIIRLEEPA